SGRPGVVPRDEPAARARRARPVPRRRADRRVARAPARRHPRVGAPAGPAQARRPPRPPVHRRPTSPQIYWAAGSPYAWRVLLAAEIKRIPYESKLLEFSKGDLKTPEYLAVSPRGKVPAIRDGDFTLGESLAILGYLDRKHPEPPLF